MVGEPERGGHDSPRQGAGPGAHEAVGVVREERAGVHHKGARLEGRHPPDEVGAVGIVADNGLALDPPHQDVVEDPGGIEARLAGHRGDRSTRCSTCQGPLFLVEKNATHQKNQDGMPSPGRTVTGNTGSSSDEDSP